MSPLLVAVVVLSATPTEGVKETASPPALTLVEKKAEGRAEKADVSPRKGAKLREAVRVALRRWAKPSDEEADRAAREFLTLFQELRADDQLSRSQRRYFEGKVRIRLMQLSDQITLRIARQKRLAKARQRDGVEPADARAGSTAQDAQSTGSSPADSAAGPGPGSPAFGGGAFQTPDYGQQLVDLIQTVIRPESWDINGGPGTIYYWYPGRALVIRQTDEVHGQIGDVLIQLRRAGP